MALSAADDIPGDIRSRVRIIASASKRKASPQFETIAQSTIKRAQLIISYFTRSTNSHALRTVSPQRLIYYRENWYLIAWCHKADGLRMFALDAIDSVEEVREPALTVEQDRIDAMIGDNFGLYSGHDRQWAKLKFSAVQARWAQAEIWHPEQKSTSLEDGSYILEVPYSNDKELILEILRFGRHIEVLAPAQLRNSVIEQLKQALAQY
jgi:predicted DNA-binding transcriptional regulator YafY